MMKCMLTFPAIVFFLIFITGCSHVTPRGYIYTHTTKPLDLNLSKTPGGGVHRQGNIKHLSVRYVDISWDSNAVGDIVKQSGLKTVYSADLEKLSILGLWNQYTVHLYGQE